MEKSRDGTHGFERRDLQSRGLDALVFARLRVSASRTSSSSSSILQFRPGEIISRRCGWAFHIFRGERGFFSVNKFDEVFDPVFINNFGIERIKWNTVRRIFFFVNFYSCDSWSNRLWIFIVRLNDIQLRIIDYIDSFK